MKVMSTVCGIGALLGGIIAIAAAFLPWATIGSMGIMDSYTGWELFTNGKFGDFAPHYVAVIALILGAVIAAVEILTFTVIPAKHRIESMGLATVLGLVAAIVAAVFFIWKVPTDSGGFTDMGSYIAMLGGLLTLFGGMYQMRFYAFGK